MHKYFSEENFPATAGCCKEGKAVHGLVTGHAYSFLDLAELTDDSGAVVHKIVKMRNPWSSEDYKGPWSDNDPNWTEAWKEQVNLVTANDGIFWMEWDTFMSAFATTDVALYFKDEDYQHKMFKLHANE